MSYFDFKLNDLKSYLKMILSNNSMFEFFI